jgi:hypothetical protein
MAKASAMNTYSFAVNHNEAVQLISTNGMNVSYVFEGEPGVGKSSMLKTLEAKLGDAYEYIYIDVPLKDIPDIALSMPDHATQTTKAFINSIWKGEDESKPKVIMLDEVFKGSDYVKLMMNRLLLERMVGDYALPVGSIVFGTTNFQTDGVGDRTNGHTNSRVVRVPMRKPSLEEWTGWAVENGVHELVLTWANQNEGVFSSYKELEFDTDLHKNGQGVFHYIYHPQNNAQFYVCPRTLALASHQVHNMDSLGEALLTKALIGTIGHKAALDMVAMISLGADLPHPKDIEAAPDKARVPQNAIAQIMMVYKSMQYINEKNLDAYVTYFERFRIEMMSTWMKTIINSNNHRSTVLGNKKIVKFATANAWVLG